MRRNGIAGLACAIALAAFAAPSALAQDPPDTQGPEITIAAPGEGHDYGVGEQVTALYVCSDPSGVAECTGTAPAGQPIDTATTGPHTFTVTAKDQFGNSSSASVTYTVLHVDDDGDTGGAMSLRRCR